MADDGAAVGSSTFDMDQDDGLEPIAEDNQGRPMYTADDGDMFSDDGGDGEYDDDDADYEMDEINPDHPALARVQAALKRQILTQKQRLEAEIREKKGHLKEIQRRREDTGVALYNSQQILARQQMKLEKAEDQRAEIAARRDAFNERLDEARGLYERMESRSEAIERQVREARLEMQKLDDQARQIRANTEEVESGLKRAVRKADKALSVEREAEIAKQQQDLYVDRLADQVRQAEDRAAILHTKLEAQRELTQQSLQRLNEAQEELDQLKIERREVQQQWQASLIALTKRSEMKHAMQEACEEQRQAIYTHANELTAVKKQQEAAQEEAEMAELRKRRIATDRARLQRTLGELNRRIDAAKSDYSVLTSTLKDSEHKLQVASRNYHLQVSKNNELRIRLEKAAQRKADLQAQLMTATYNAATLTKAGQNTLKSIKSEQKLSAEGEMRLHQEENKLAREEIKVQALEAGVAEAAAERDAVTARLVEKEQTLDGYESESRKNQRAIDSKESAILLLQRKIDNIMERRAKEGAGRAEISPMELERDSTRAAIATTAAENAQLQQQWLQSQHEYVMLMKEMAQHSEEIEELKTRNSVLLRKKLRLTRDVEANQLELRRAKNKYSLMQNDIVKLNALINKNKVTADSLESGTELMEVDFLRMLKDEELNSIKLQEDIETITEERARLDQDLVESEREILLWEKKIQLAEEMKATLKGEDEAGAELLAMKAEIHRMELRSAQLDRQKENLIQEMEKSVDRRGEIEIRSRASLQNKSNATVSKLKKQILDLRKRVNQTQRDAQRAEEQANTTELETDELRKACEDARREHQETQDAIVDAEHKVAVARRQRHISQEAITRDQQLYKHLSHARSRSKVFRRSAEDYDKAIQEQVDTLNGLNNAAGFIANECPEYAPLFEPVGEDISRRLATMK
eukprot:m.82876 g.82876  ORF g.82876 m.82876 type:complete len:927 (+) comp9501_c0_seq1:89-2869(+)